MGKIITGATMSIDGYIAGPGESGFDLLFQWYGNGDVETPSGPLVNSQSRNGFGNLGLAWTGTKGYFGGSYGYDDTKYGIPVVEDGEVQLTPRRHAFSLRGGGQDLSGVFDSFRATLAVRRYQHEELANGAVEVLLLQVIVFVPRMVECPSASSAIA